ncbi:hypothetical protein KDN24_06710 [Bacillus sp. Bva_UNVM-123]
MMMKPNELFQFIDRNSKRWSAEQIKRFLKEVERIQRNLESKLKRIEGAA